MRSRSGSMPSAQCSRKLSQPSASSRQLCSTSCAIDRHEDVELEVAGIPPMLTATSLPITCAAAMVSASDCVGLTLPGMIELPGSFSGIAISPMPAARARGQPAHVVRDLVERRRDRPERAVREDQRVLRGERLELVRRADERLAGELGEPRRRARGRARGAR